MLKYKAFLLYLLFVFLFSTSVFSQPNYTVSGYVRDAGGEELIGATVYVPLLKRGVITNEYGFYSIILPQGEYSIVVSYLGYESATEDVQLINNQALNFSLELQAKQLGTIEVKGEAVDRHIREVDMSTINLSIKTIEKIPSLYGERDIIKAVQLLPGVASGVEGTGGFYVRGGNVDQNLVLLDGANVYNASHLSGFISVFNPDIIKSLKLYKGGIPAEYGGRLASVLDVRMKEGNNQEFNGEAGIGSITSRVLVEAPIVKDRSSFVVAGRRSYADLFLKLSPDESQRNSTFYFYDLNVKGNYKINDKNRIFLSGYFGHDAVGFSDDFLMKYGNVTGTMRWNCLINDRLFLNTSYIYSNYNYSLNFSFDDKSGLDWKSNILAHKLNTNLTYFLNANNTVKFGFESLHHTFKPGKTNYITEGNSIEYSLPDNYGLESGVFVQNEQSINEALSLQYGLRLSTFSNIGPAESFEYDRSEPKEYTVKSNISYPSGVYNTFFNVEPRFSLRCILDENSSVKGSYNRMYQYIHLASNTVASTPLDVWFPSSPNVEPQCVDQTALGYFRNFKGNTIEASVEMFYKDMKNVVDFRDHADLFVNEQFEGELRIGKGWAYGAEFFVKKPVGRLTGWISYTYSKSWRDIPEIHDDPFVAPYDRPHDFSVVTFYEISERVSVSANWVYATGQPINVPAHKAEYGGVILPIYPDSRNTYRYKNYHRLDLSLTMGTKRGKGEWIFSIYNVYNRDNTFALRFDTDPVTGKVDAYGQYLFPILPSVTYNFKF